MSGISVSGFDTVLDALDYDVSGTAKYTVKARAEYAVFVEFGSSRNQAQPFIRPAVEQTMRNIDTLIDDTADSDEIARILAEDIADNSRGNAPVDTGNLRDSITVEEQ
ncbi:hypothetical protein OB919_20035 [Halobacteria archaeon AArc-curdl1]|uniref:Uncharacterized protein n=1 Tax=Natronosalvus hydrolyticus TaxID=2979988 RepID=A0AAP3E823_9EURY|nr:hypothetical protein [Halobacteria archaeon AArc-curdl1]